MHASEQRRLVFDGAINAIILAGIMQIAIAGALPLARSAQTVRLIVWALVAAGYGSIVGLALAAASGYRGLTPEGPALNLIAFAGNMVVAIGSLAALPLLVWAMRGDRGTS